MQLKIIVKRAYCTKNRSKKVIIDVESFDENLVECCKKAIGECYTICFSKYYSNCNLMNLRRKFPYIIRNGKCVWKESYENVTIKEFFETHNMTEKNSVYVDVDAFGGAGDFYDILTWVVTMWPMIEPYVETSGTVVGVIDLVIKCVKALGKRIKDCPSSIDVKDFVQSKKEWTIEELGQKSNIQDNTILKLLLSQFGYKQHGEMYCYDEKLKVKYEQKLSKSEDECWGNYETYEGECDFAGSVRIINMYLTAVEICSEVDNLNAFDSIDKKIELLCKQHNCFTRNNEEELKFISFNEELFEDEETDSIDTKLNEISKLLFDFLDDYYSD